MPAQRRKDNKGRVLKDGESQRSNGTYMYRYTDNDGKRHSIYAPDLNTLRDKEMVLEKQIRNCLNYELGKITVQQLLEKLVSLRQSQAATTRMNCDKILKVVAGNPFMQCKIKDVKMSDAKDFILKLSDGRKYTTMVNYKWFFKASFAMAVEDGILVRNPFAFSLRNLLKYEPKRRYALTDEEVDIFFNYVHNNICYSKYENDFRIMLGTGLRISELYGLTMNDIDLDKRIISVTHQLIYCPAIYENKWAVIPPKSENSIRFVPMSDEVYACFLNVIRNRPTPQIEPVVDGYTNFIFLSKTKGKHDYNVTCENFLLRPMKLMEDNYKKLNPNGPYLPHITPHVFRHTFCTNLVKSGANIKTVQYLMGHATANMSLDIYAHMNQRDAFTDFYRISNANAQIAELTPQSIPSQQLSPSLTPHLTPIAVNL